MGFIRNDCFMLLEFSAFFFIFKKYINHLLGLPLLLDCSLNKTIHSQMLSLKNYFVIKGKIFDLVYGL